MPTSFDWQIFEHGIYAFDSHYQRHGMAAIHFLQQDQQIAIVDTATNLSVPYVMRGLQRIGCQPEDVTWILLTHVHLDHAGAAGQLMQACPNARLAVHPRGARHMADPKRLVEGVVAVYGQEFFNKAYGEILPICPERIQAMEDGQKIRLGSAGGAQREILCLDTPGHAKHHLAFADNLSGAIFTGDTFGLSYREMDIANGNLRHYIFPTTTPVQFDPSALHQSIDRLIRLEPSALYLTHFSRIIPDEENTRRLHFLIDQSIDIALSVRNITDAQQRYRHISAQLAEALLLSAREFGSTLSDDALLSLWEQDLELNTQGLCVWLDQQ